MLKRLLEHILPKGIGEVVLSVKEAAGWMDGERGQLHMITMALSSHWCFANGIFNMSSSPNWCNIPGIWSLVKLVFVGFFGGALRKRPWKHRNQDVANAGAETCQGEFRNNFRRWSYLCPFNLFDLPSFSSVWWKITTRNHPAFFWGLVNYVAGTCGCQHGVLKAPNWCVSVSFVFGRWCLLKLLCGIFQELITVYNVFAGLFFCGVDWGYF